MSGPAAPAQETTDEGSLHQQPLLWPFVGLIVIYASVAGFFYLLRDVPFLQKWFFALADAPDDFRPVIGGSLLVAGVGLVYDFVRRFKAPHVSLYLRVNRAFLYAFALVLAWNCYEAMNDAKHLRALAFDNAAQWKNLAALLVLTALFFFAVMWPLAQEAIEEFVPYQRAVASLDNTYDFIIGAQRPRDWKKAETGPKKWAVLAEKAIWQNLFVLGAIGTGKTNLLAYPLITQALRKFKDNDELRPAIVMLDLKGDNAERMWQLCRRLGRADDFFCVRPGNAIQDHQGKDLIPPDRFLTYDPLGAASDSADVRAELFSSALQVTAQGETHQFWLDTQVQFLTATLQIFDAVRGPNQYSLVDVYMFALDPVLRDSMVKSEQAKGSPAQTYFQKYFNAFAKDDQMKLLSGIAAKLSRITGEATRATFCADPDSRTKRFTSFDDFLLKKSGIIVFSVPEATYSTELARILGVMFMRSFHNAMLRRSDTVFKAAGGNTKRLVMLVVDECWAYMNPGVGSFCNVSRQARVMSVFLTQSLKAIADQYRDAVLSGFLSKVIFAVNDELTQTTMAKALGQHEETITNVSTSESLGDAKKKVYTEGMTGKNQGISRSVSQQRRTVDRFNATELKFQGKDRAVVQLSDGAVALTPFAVEMTPSYRLPFFLLNPLDHDDVGCPATKRRSQHVYVADGDGEKCTACGHKIGREQRADIEEYRANFPSNIAS